MCYNMKIGKNYLKRIWKYKFSILLCILKCRYFMFENSVESTCESHPFKSIFKFTDNIYFLYNCWHGKVFGLHSVQVILTKVFLLEGFSRNDLKASFKIQFENLTAWNFTRNGSEYFLTEFSTVWMDLIRS